MAKTPAQPNRSVQDGLECLWQLVAEARPVGSRELARMMEMEPTRANRMLGTLAAMGLAAQTPDRKYVAGPGIHVLAAMSLRGSHLLDAAGRPMQKLVENTGGRVALGVLWRRRVCYLFHGRPDRAPLASVAGHNLYPAERSSIGKVLLAAHTEDVIKERFAEQDVDVAQLLTELREVRRLGYAVNREDGRAQSIAVAVGRPAVAGLAVMCDVTDQNRNELLAALGRAVDSIEENMGH
jgi:DNA-binding IclR family transcriptional regulator